MGLYEDSALICGRSLTREEFLAMLSPDFLEMSEASEELIDKLNNVDHSQKVKYTSIEENK